MHLVHGFKNLESHNAPTGTPTAEKPVSDRGLCNDCAGPKDESTYLDRIARTRRLYFVLAVGWAFVYVGVELLKGLFS
jgi:hypothetical protein